MVSDGNASSMPNLLSAPQRPPFSASPPRFIIIGAGSRGGAYAKALGESTNGICAGVVDPIAYKRQHLGQQHVWGLAGPSPGQEFGDWKEFLAWETARRARQLSGEDVPEGVDGAFICVQDGMHKDVILGLAALNLHVMCEKPLATTMHDCVSIYRSMVSGQTSRIFSIGHVLRYSPHNMLLRKLLLEDRVIGDVLSINHTEPVGWWHFAHSYVRGNWRKERTSAPSLLTKSCHDIDILLWLLCSAPPNSAVLPHFPSRVTSLGALQYFQRARKPARAGAATNCLSCVHEPDCKFSAKKIYVESGPKSFRKGNLKWPVEILVPDIEEHVSRGGVAAGESALLSVLRDDYDASTPVSEISRRNWFGRCAWECDNDVCDDQVVTLQWDADPISHSVSHSPSSPSSPAPSANRHAKLATFHMVAFTDKICERYTHIYGSEGEIYADSKTITVQKFDSEVPEAETRTVHHPHMAGGGHGGGDGGLARQFVLAVDRVKNHGMHVAEAQREYVGCDIEEIVRSHAVVFAAEAARRRGIVVDFNEWWLREVESLLRE